MEQARRDQGTKARSEEATERRSDEGAEQITPEAVSRLRLLLGGIRMVAQEFGEGIKDFPIVEMTDSGWRTIGAFHQQRHASLFVIACSTLPALLDAKAERDTLRSELPEINARLDVVEQNYLAVVKERDELRRVVAEQRASNEKMAAMLREMAENNDAMRARLGKEATERRSDGGAELSFAAFAASNRVRCQQSFHAISGWSPTDWACAVAGEVGELCNLVKKHRRGEHVPVSDIADEAGDVVAYLDLLCQRFGIRLEDAVRDKFNRVSVRIGSGVILPTPAPGVEVGPHRQNDDAVVMCLRRTSDEESVGAAPPLRSEVTRLRSEQDDLRARLKAADRMLGAATGIQICAKVGLGEDVLVEKINKLTDAAYEYQSLSGGGKTADADPSVASPAEGGES